MINSFPYHGTISRISESDFGEDTSTVIYDGVMDCTLVTAEVGKIAQTADYVVSIPLTKDAGGHYVLPAKEDMIIVSEYGVERNLKVDNYVPSQVGGVTIYCNMNN